jgi:hypothetical protein
LEIFRRLLTNAHHTELGMRHRGRLTALFAVALMIPAVRGEACSCPGADPPPSEARSLATAVFEGTIVDQRAVLIKAFDMTTAAIDSGSNGACSTLRTLRSGISCRKGLLHLCGER